MSRKTATRRLQDSHKTAPPATIARYLEVRNMAWECPYSPLELHALNLHGFEYGDRVVLPDARTGMVSKVGYKYGHIDADTGADWRGLLTELRPAVPTEVGQPRMVQLSLL